MILKLRTSRTSMQFFPFDVCYLASVEHRDVLPKLFPWSLCLPVGERLQQLLRRPIDVYEELPVCGRLTERTFAEGEALRNEMVTQGNLFLLVPVMPQRRATLREAQRSTQGKGWDDYRKWGMWYITAPQHVAKKPRYASNGPISTGENKFRDLFDERAVLFTPDGPACPPCIKCGRHLLHLQGKCHFGSSLCYETLVLKELSQPEKPHETKKTSPNTQESCSEQLSGNPTDSD